MTQSTNRPLVAIVDGYSTGNFLPAAFARHGADVIHVLSTKEWSRSMLLPDLEQYVGNIVHTTVEETAAALKERGVVAVVAGQEPGVPLTDALSEALGIAGNGTELSAAKRDKFQMIEAVRSAGLHAAAQCRARTSEELMEWARQLGALPVVVKPLSSASTDGVSICDSIEMVGESAAQVLDSVDIFDLPNEWVLGQSYLDGDEYIVDTVSAQGRRYIAGIWRYEKKLVNGKNIYDRDVLVDSTSEEAQALIGYMDAVLDTFNIEWGPTHTEIKLTSSGPALVEIGARLNGNMNPGFHDQCLGHNQADLIALAYLAPDQFVEQYGGQEYKQLQPAVVYNAPSEKSGTIKEVATDVVQSMEELPSVYLVSVKLGPGKELKRTIDLLTSPLRIFLTAQNQDTVEQDYATLRGLKDSVYVI